MPNKRLGKFLSGSVTETQKMPENKVQVITDPTHPVLIQDNGNLKAMNIQFFVSQAAATELFPDASVTRFGFVIRNNGLWKIYVGISSDAVLLKKIGLPVSPNESFSSAKFQGKLYVVADTAAGVNTVDVRVWEEQL
jgi:hypothetical protein